MRRRIYSWYRQAGLEVLFGPIVNKVRYDLTPYTRGRAGGGPDAFADQKSANPIAGEYRKTPAAGNSIAVACCISGAHDLLVLPPRLLPGVDHVCFSDRPRHDRGIFQIRPIDFISADPARSECFLKTHLHRCLSDYDTVIWLDANAVVDGDLQLHVDAFERSGKAFAALAHPLRESVHEEAQACKESNEDDPGTIDAQMARYRREGFDCSDLIASSFFICRPKDEVFRRFCGHWWSEIDKHSRCDQLSINYALSKTGLEWWRLTHEGENRRNHCAFGISRHNQAEAGPGQLSPAAGRVIDPYAGPSYAGLKRRRLASQRHRPVDIVICVHDALDHARACLSSLVPTLGPRHRVILVDDGCSPPTATWLRDAAAANGRTLLVPNEFRLGYTKAANIGLRTSSASFVILLNSDTIVTKDWIEKLSDAVFTSEGAGIVGPLSNAGGFQSIPEHRGQAGQSAINEIPEHISIKALNRWCEEWTVSSILPRVPLVHGFCLGIKREVIDRIGLFDEESFPNGYGEEDDYCFRAIDAGFDLMVATHTYVFHAKSKSYSADERVRLMESGMATLVAKHGAQRVERTGLMMRNNPILQVFRERARQRYLTRPLHTRVLARISGAGQAHTRLG